MCGTMINQKGEKNQQWLVSGFYTIVIIDVSSFYVVSLYWYKAVHTLTISLCYLVVVLGLVTLCTFL